MGTVDRTAAPSGVVLPEPEAAFPGSIVYAKAGNIWIQTGDSVRELTTTGTDSMPSWSPDGETVYFIRTTEEIGQLAGPGPEPPVPDDDPEPDGDQGRRQCAKAERLRSGKFKKGGNTWFYWMRQPVLSPNGKTFALVSDAPGPVEVRRHPAVLGSRHEEDDGPEGDRDPAARPPGPRLASGWEAAVLRPKRPRGSEGCPDHLPLGRRQEDVVADHRTRLSRALVLAGRQVHRGDEDQRIRLRHRHPRCGPRA